jgi:hypothetical protein
MINFEDHKAFISSLCKKHAIKKFYVFGSNIKGNARNNNDIDFLVEFELKNLHDYFINFMDLKESLEKYFNNKVDLVEMSTIKNPYLKIDIDEHKVLLYG